jgi:cytidylate kinase
MLALKNSKKEAVITSSEKLMKTKRITLSGEVAAGKTSVGIELARMLNFEFISIGNLSRLEAAGLGMNIAQFQAFLALEPHRNLALDKSFAQLCNEKTDIIVDYRMGFKFVHEAYNIFLKISEPAAMDRLKKAKREDESYQTLKERNESFKEQFLALYGVNILDERHYDLVIDTEKFTSPTKIAEFVIRKIYERK